jgi:GNAT superfamily N-acetyltransferase
MENMLADTHRRGETDRVKATVRPATLADVPELVRLGGLMYASMGQDASAPEWIAAAEADARARLGHDLASFVADDPGAPGRLVASGAGTIGTRLPAPLNLGGRVGYIQWISTEVPFRRQGLARQIMVALLDWFDEQGVRTVELHATADGEPLYRALGFSDDPPMAMRRRGYC